MIRFLRFVCVFWAFSTNAQTIQNNFIAGKTTGILPFLEYGLGIDRLGGAKMTYLDTGITIKVVDSTIVNYKVQLSKDHFAYLPKQNFQRENDIKPLPYYLTNSWRVSGDDRYDYVTVTLDEKLPYRSMQQINPSKIVVDIFGATGNTNWITQLSTAEEIKNVYHEQLEDDVFRVIIELKNKQHWGYSIYYQEKRLVIRVKRQPAEPDLKNLKVAVDAGHGGDNNGARGVTTKILEKEYTLLFAKQLEKLLLDEKAAIFMARDKDTTLNMPDRILTLQKEDPHFLISIHLNSSARDSIREPVLITGI
ncbi:MAG: N-acetylmuramoyl-L-alanine amidase [Chitinophagaceae bacterium]|nr:N-acetylmuramoyl-L-alanine amidase [Chitinophagaceae bacterium]